MVPSNWFEAAYRWKNRGSRRFGRRDTRMLFKVQTQCWTPELVVSLRGASTVINEISRNQRVGPERTERTGVETCLTTRRIGTVVRNVEVTSVERGRLLGRVLRLRQALMIITASFEKVPKHETMGTGQTRDYYSVDGR